MFENVIFGLLHPDIFGGNIRKKSMKQESRSIVLSTLQKETSQELNPWEWMQWESWFHISFSVTENHSSDVLKNWIKHLTGLKNMDCRFWLIFIQHRTARMDLTTVESVVYANGHRSRTKWSSSLQYWKDWQRDTEQEKDYGELRSWTSQYWKICGNPWRIQNAILRLILRKLKEQS